MASPALIFMTRMRIASKGWAWVPSLYIFQGIPSNIVLTTSVLMFTDMGVGASQIVMWTGLASLPWSLKPLWSPIVESRSSLRNWVKTTELILTLCIIGLAGSLMTDMFFGLSLIMMTVIAISSATHDIACDGYYMEALDKEEQSFFVGIRSTFYRVATIAAGGVVPIVSGRVARASGSEAEGWATAIATTGLLLGILYIVNRQSMPIVKETPRRQDGAWQILIRAFGSFFTHRGAIAAITFFLTYRLGEAQLSKIVPIYMVDGENGVGMSVTTYGVIYGTVGVIALTAGGILGGLMASKIGLRRSLWPMILMMNLPNIAYVMLAHYGVDMSQTSGLAAVCSTVIIEQFGYGFGFSAYMLAILNYVRDSEYKAAEYSIGTALMTLGLIVPSLPSGHLLESLGYEKVFIIACIATIPGMIAAHFMRIEEK